VRASSWLRARLTNTILHSGFATTQQAYEEAVQPLFKSLERVEKILEDGREFLVGGQLTEADIRLFTCVDSPPAQLCSTLTHASLTARSFASTPSTS
jgi:glutathionyl-hydroquinone reductase